MIIMKLLRSVYFLAKNRLPLTATFDDMIQLQIENGNEVLKQHDESGPLNAQYTSNYSVVTLLYAIDTWLDKKLVSSLASSTYFYVLADECEDISTAEEPPSAADGSQMENLRNTLLHCSISLQQIQQPFQIPFALTRSQRTLTTTNL